MNDEKGLASEEQQPKAILESTVMILDGVKLFFESSKLAGFKFGNEDLTHRIIDSIYKDGHHLVAMLFENNSPHTTKLLKFYDPSKNAAINLNESFYDSNINGDGNNNAGFSATIGHNKSKFTGLKKAKFPITIISGKTIALLLKLRKQREVIEDQADHGLELVCRAANLGKSKNEDYKMNIRLFWG